MKKGIVAGGVVLAMLLVGAWLYASPYLALRGLKQSIEAENPQAMYDYVDFPAFKTGLKREMLKDMKVEADNPFAYFGNKMVEGLVEMFVNPETIIKIFAKRADGKAEKAPSAGIAPEFDLEKDKLTMGYAGLNTFELVMPSGKDGGSWTFIMHRKGLGWKIDDVRIVPGTKPVAKEDAVASDGGVLSSLANDQAADSAQAAADAAVAAADAAAAGSGESEAFAAAKAAEADAAEVEASLSPNANVAVQPSFNCARASSAAEHMICADSRLAQLDLALASAYRAALVASDDPSGLKAEQNSWRTTSRDVCYDADSVQAAYESRIAELQAL